jgi:gamma-glutamylcyclotransferase (GGCT)/AIG2-like uncharacterized protein YtfP
MTLYFAYGANMERDAMAVRCRGGAAVGVAVLRGWRYVIANGYGTLVRAPGATVHGVLWRLTPRDLAALNLFEALDSGLYRRMLVTVEVERRRARVLAYVGRPGGRPRPMPGYQERVVAAAEAWRLPARYVVGLRRLSPGYRGVRPVETGELA